MSNKTAPGDADPGRRMSFVRDMFNRSARHYDAANRLFSLGSGAWYRRACLRWGDLRPGMTVLDVAVGTGLLAREMIAITHDRGAIVGVDVSEAMLAIAHAKLGIPLIEAAAEALPLRSASFDVVTMGYALRHVADIEASFREALRVLRPGGMIIVLEISAPEKKPHRAIAAGYIGRFIPLLALLTTRDQRARTLMRYHWDTIVNTMPPEAVLSAMRDSGFETVERWTELDLFHCYKGRKAARPMARGAGADWFTAKPMPIAQLAISGRTRCSARHKSRAAGSECTTDRWTYRSFGSS